ncbi:MAG: secondary thiamine-phosphate synthase enzyme YjbQ [Bacteroidota bacterium]|nr:secondary thiamine-phosphate synthase enzyme YjbQ [Bacteroidota bacterium]
MQIFQKQFQLKERRRGFHLITSEIAYALPLMSKIKTGVCLVFILHTSASLTINENASPDVRKDFENFFDKIVPENHHDYLHSEEGTDDMPAHLKSSLLGTSVTIPISDGKLCLGIWQGIYLCEHRNNGGKRNISITTWGD